MKTNIFLGAALGLSAIAMLDLAIVHGAAPVHASEIVDVKSVKRLQVRGVAGRLIISTDDKQPYTAQLLGVRSGWGTLWRTGWFEPGCPLVGSLSIEKSTLEVDTGDEPHISSWTDCTLELRVNLQPDVAVLITQQAAAITLTGNFSLLDIHADAGDVRLDGHANDLTLSGAALRARLTFETIAKNETIRLLGRMMDATLIFPGATAISYAVETAASFIDSALPNTPGAKPSITIRGDMVRVTIR